MLVSIIVPVYDVEQYLPKCIISILRQSFTDFELLLINDGSTDRSGEICDKFAIIDNRVKVFHKNNGGVSSARNLGIENAKGDWITFIDADDFISSNFLTCFFNYKNDNFDLIIQGMSFYPSNKLVYKFEYERKYSVAEFLDVYLLNPYFFSPCSKLYKTEIIIKNNIKFDKAHSYGEDTLFNLDYAFNCKNDIILLNSITYHYREDTGGLSTRRLSFGERKILFEDVKSRLIKICRKENHLFLYILYMFRELYDTGIKNTRAELAQLVRKHNVLILSPYQDNLYVYQFLVFLLKTNNIFLLDKSFKWMHRKKQLILK